MNNQVEPVMMGNTAKRICVSRMNNQHYLCITDALRIIILIIHGYDMKSYK